LTFKTDIGRHNTLDKIYGYILENSIPIHDKVIVFSGRISSEVLLKISKIGIGVIISKAAPTDLALELAHDLGITAIGFTRGHKMNIYTHPERVTKARTYRMICTCFYDSSRSSCRATSRNRFFLTSL